MANRGSHFTGEMGGSLAQAFSHPDMGRFVGGMAVLGVVTAPFWLTAGGLFFSLLLMLGGPEAAATAWRGSAPGPIVTLLWPWLSIAAMASLVFAFKTWRRRGVDPVLVRAETRWSRRVAKVAWILVALVATLGGFRSGVYAEARFRTAHPDLDSRYHQSCPHLFPKGETNMARIPGDPVPGHRRTPYPEFAQCWPYFTPADKARRCADPGRGLSSEREALQVLCRKPA